MADSPGNEGDASAPETSLADWLIALGHDSPLERAEASAAGSRPAPPLSTVPSILSLLKDGDANVRRRAAAALGDVAAECRRILPALHDALGQAALNDGDDAVRAEAARALLRAGPHSDTDVGALADAMHSELDVVRFHAAAALGDAGPASRPAVPALVHASLWDEDPVVRVAAAAALWRIDANKDPLVVSVLTRALDDANELVCWVAVDCLGQMGPAAAPAVPALRRLLERDLRIAMIKRAVTLILERVEAGGAES